MSETESPNQVLKRIYDEEYGFIPTNTSMKPVHVANAMARRIIGTQTDFRPLARMLRQYVDNQKGGFKEERNPNSAILTDYGERFADRFNNPPSDEAMTRFRSLAKDTLGADDAVFFPTLASFTLSHARMVTGDISDNGSGDFLASFLMAGAPIRPDRAAALLRALLSTDTDPWSTIGWPLLDLGEQVEATLGATAQVRAERSSAMLATDKNGLLVSPTLRTLRDRYDQLADYEAAHGSKLTTLRRLVLFGVFAIHIHAVHRCHDVVPDGPLPPLLLDLFDGRRRSLREASAATLQGGFRAIEQLVVHRIHEHLDEVCDKPAKFVAALPDSDEWDAVRIEFDAQLAGGEPIEALAEAFWKVGYSGVGPKEVQGFPWNTLLALGRRAGYLLPYDNRGRGGKEHKRYGANAEFAELLVASTVTPGEPVDFDEFLDRIRDSFGIVVGRTADFNVIRNNDLRPGAPVRRSVSVIESDLRANLHAFRDLIIDVGFAKSYADGRTVVTTDEAAA